MGITYDAGALIAAERGERRMWARHRALLLRREVPMVPAPVLAQAWRGTARQAQLARLVAGCDIEFLDDVRAKATGIVAGRARTTDIVDACVVEGAARRRDPGRGPRGASGRGRRTAGVPRAPGRTRVFPERRPLAR